MKLLPFEIHSTPRLYNIPWNVQQVNAPLFWPHTRGNGTVVAIIDTGIDINHPEFSSRIFKPFDFTGTGMTDKEGHGTHVAGIIAGNSCGIAPAARIMPLKVFGGNQGQIGLNIHDALRYILDHNKVCNKADRVVAVNCSFGGSVYDSTMAYFIRRLISTDVAVICSAGNQGDGNPETHEAFSYPAYIWEVITVGAMSQDGQSAGYSNSFDGIDVGAPGTNIYSAWPGGGYKLLSGTSMAAPHVTGAMALICSDLKQKEGVYPSLDKAESALWCHIRKTAIDSRLTGKGFLDLTYSSIAGKLMDVAPFIQNDRTFTPARFVAEALGANVTWHNPARKVEIVKDYTRIEMWIDNKTYRITSRGVV